MASRFLTDLMYWSIPNCYQSRIYIPDTRIIALSDIHADIQSLIISLRDCAQVIKKDNFNPNKYDVELEVLLDIDISEEDNGYDETLGYTWCGDNSIVVIIGDIIDGSRGSDNLFIEKQINGIDTTIHDYHQLEIKLLRFINIINKMAMLAGGRIYKLFGNHEIANILRFNHFKNQTFQRLGNTPNYIRNRITGVMENRYNTFEIGNYGYNLLLEDGIGFMLIINNNIFVHGTIQQIRFEIIEKINILINHQEFDIDKKNDIFKIFSSEGNNLGKKLWARKYGKPINEVESSDEYGDYPNECNLIRKDIQKFLDLQTIEDADDYKVIVGHCIQLDNAHDPVMTTYNIHTRTNYINDIPISDNFSFDISNNTSTGQINIGQNRFYGISMACQHPDEDKSYKHLLYRVDIGSSRSQDQGFLTQKHIDFLKSTDDKVSIEKQLLTSRIPQVLEIFDDDINIIRSRLKNSRIHQIRPRYETQIRDYPELNVFKTENTHYYKKYLKYKKKYLQLK